MVHGESGEPVVDEEGRPVNGLIDRYYAGMLNCGLDASINDRANRSRFPEGQRDTLRRCWWRSPA